MARVVWSRAALRHLELIRAYLEQFDPAAAERLSRRLYEAGESLRDYPARGRPADNGKRELPTIAPYVIRYSVQNGVVRILRIKHGRQR